MFALIIFLIVYEPVRTGFYVDAVAVVNYPFCDNKISAIAIELANNSNNETEIVLNIANWVSRNINWSTNASCKRSFYIYTPCDVLAKKCGACGEKSDLISSMLNSIGIDAVSVATLGEDHTWNEVKINNEWIFLDATADGGVDNFNMSKRDFEKNPDYNRSLSYVIAYYPNETRFDVTRNYTDTNKLIVYVEEKSGEPISGINVIVKSHYLNPPHASNSCVTNDSGICSFELGGYNYTIDIQKYYFSFIEKNVTLTENGQPINITLQSVNPDKLLVLIVIIGIVFIALIRISFKAFHDS